MSTVKKQLLQDVLDLKAALSEKDKVIAEMTIRVAILEEYVFLTKSKTFGVSSEKSVEQQKLFNEVELIVVAEEVAEKANKK